MPASPLPETLTIARLVAVSGPLGGEVLPLAGTGTTIGRDTANDICVPDIALSRSHCAISHADGEWRIADCGSSNGTFVNGTRVSEQPLRHRDRIDLGESTFIFVGADPAAHVPPVDDRPSSVIARADVGATAFLRPDLVRGADGHAERHLGALLTLSAVAGSLATEDLLYDRILETVATTLSPQQVAVVIIDSGAEPRVAAVQQVNGSAAAAVSRDVVLQAMHGKVGLLSRDAGDAVSALSVLCVPIVVRDQSLAAIYVTAAGTTPFDAGHLAFATALASVAAAALDTIRHVAWLREERTRLQRELKRDQHLVGQSAAMERVYEIVARVARSDATVLITGETGTGKELVARAVHGNSPRAQRPFVAVNCAALTDTLLESELFGHERGAFTGAHVQKKGKLEAADGGTVFLDEIGELPLLLQSKLLRALQLREFDRVGGTRPVRVDIRVLAATNRDLAAEVSAGRFRSDLYHRLHVVDVHVPPLRERREDIAPLAAHFVARFSRAAARPVRGIAPAALHYLLNYDWPGNVRELENTIERAIVLGSSDHVVPDDLPDALLEGPSPASADVPRFHEAVREAKTRAILQAFRDAHGSYTDTARLLGLNANYLHRLIKNLRLKPILEREP
jgi:Nif-specific regulatory protein